MLRPSQLQQHSYYTQGIKFFCLIWSTGRDHDSYLVNLPDFRSESNTPISLLKLTYLMCSKRLPMTETAQPPEAIFVLSEPSCCNLNTLLFRPIHHGHGNLFYYLSFQHLFMVLKTFANLLVLPFQFSHNCLTGLFL